MIPPTRDGEARALLNSGYILLRSGRISQALESQSKAIELSSAVNDIYTKGKADGALGLIFAYSGEPAKSLNHYEEAQLIFQKIGDRDSQAATLNGMGFLQRTMGEYEESANLYRRAGAIFAALHDSTGQIGAMEGEAKAEWALHHRLSARNLFASRLRLARQNGDIRVRASALLDLADTYGPGQPGAESLYRKSLEVCRSAQYTVGQVNALISLAHLYSATGRNEEAVGLLHQVLQLDPDAAGPANLARTHYELAVAYEHQSQLEMARDESESATRIIEDLRTKPTDLDTRASYFASVHLYYQFHIEVLMELEQQHPHQGFSRQAFEAAERSKVRSLLDMLHAGECSDSAESETRSVSGEKSSSNIREHSIDNCSLPATDALTMVQIQNELDSDSVLLEYELGRTAAISGHSIRPAFPHMFCRVRPIYLHSSAGSVQPLLPARRHSPTMQKSARQMPFTAKSHQSCRRCCLPQCGHICRARSGSLLFQMDLCGMLRSRLYRAFL